MKAIEFNQYGGPDVLHLVDVEAPHAGPGEVRIKVRAAGVNPSDWKRREGQYRAFEDVRFPAGLGVEGAGIVDQVGSGVTDVAIGDPVFGFGENTMAEQAVLTHWARKPDNLSFEVAAGLLVVSDTATRALDQVGVAEGQTLLVSGAAGGVGTAIVQLARLRGITVIGTASATKHDYLRELGAVPTTYAQGLQERVRELAPACVDAAIDVAGSGIIPELIRIVGDPAHVLSVADFSAEKYAAKFSHGPPVDPARLFAKMADLCSAGSFTLRIDRTFPLDRAKEAQEVSQSGLVTGKLVVCVDYQRQRVGRHGLPDRRHARRAARPPVRSDRRHVRRGLHHRPCAWRGARRAMGPTALHRGRRAQCGQFADGAVRIARVSPSIVRYPYRPPPSPSHDAVHRGR